MERIKEQFLVLAGPYLMESFLWVSFFWDDWVEFHLHNTKQKYGCTARKNLNFPFLTAILLQVKKYILFYKSRHPLFLQVRRQFTSSHEEE